LHQWDQTVAGDGSRRRRSPPPRAISAPPLVEGWRSHTANAGVLLDDAGDGLADVAFRDPIRLARPQCP
jgi:hypothetical protein